MKKSIFLTISLLILISCGSENSQSQGASTAAKCDSFHDQGNRIYRQAQEKYAQAEKLNCLPFDLICKSRKNRLMEEGTRLHRQANDLFIEEYRCLAQL